MGLDMYLYARHFVWDSYSNNGERLPSKVKVEGVPGLIPGKVRYIKMDVAYWRKANAIHRWFVENVQNGEDDCGYYHVSRDELRNLISLCRATLKDKNYDVALPTQSGFFFGGTAYDEFYVSYLKDTIVMLEEALALPDNWDFEYHSSW